MPMLKTPNSDIRYEEYGDAGGYPVLLMAPGFLSARIERWGSNPARPGVQQAWMDPTEELARWFRVIAFDIRNAGQSTAPIREGDGWHSYTADTLALLAHLGIEKCHVMGACIGVSFALALAEAAPGRVTALVLQNPIGLSDTNRAALDREFNAWAEEQKQRGTPDPKAIAALHESMFGNDFIFAVTRDFVASCKVPMFLMPGDDVVHPTEISADLARLAPDIEVMPDWKKPEMREPAMRRVEAFLVTHRPPH